jgi:hypothetical protein
VSGGIGREAHCLADSGQATAAAAGGKGMLERQFRFLVDEPAGHHEVAGDPFRAVGFEGLDLVLRGPVEFLARDVLVDFGRTLTVRAVGAAQVAGVGNPGRAVLSPVAAELAGAGVAAVKAAGTAVLPAGTVFAGCTVLPVTEGPAVVSATKAAAVTLAVAARPVTKGLTVAITERPALATAKAAAVTLALAARPVTKGLTVTVAKTAVVTLTFTARTVRERLTVTITKRLTLAATKTAPIAVALPARTVRERLTVRVTAETAAVTGAEAPRIPARIIGPPKRAPLPPPVASRVSPVISAAVTAAFVLSHGGFLL